MSSQPAAPPGQKSFTSLLIRTLREMRAESEEPFSTFSLAQKMKLEHTRYTPELWNRCVDSQYIAR